MPAECGEDIEDAAEGFDGRLEHLPHLTGPWISGRGVRRGALGSLMGLLFSFWMISLTFGFPRRSLSVFN